MHLRIRKIRGMLPKRYPPISFIFGLMIVLWKKWNLPKKFFAQTHPYLPYARATFLGDSRASRGVKKINWNISRSLYSYALKFSAFILLNEIFQMRPFSYPGELNKSRFWIFNFFWWSRFHRPKKSEAGGLFQKNIFSWCLMTWMIRKCKEIFGTKLQTGDMIL